MKASSESLGFEEIEHASLTDVGIRRSHNQDAFSVLLAPSLDTWQERGHVFIVADGMGAHAVGELASTIAADIIPHTYQKHATQGPQFALKKAFDEANANIHQRGQQNREFQGMGTTSTALVIRPEGAWVAHVGDSRAYRIRGNQVEQLSFDHSLQWELARRQQVAPESIAGIPSNVIVRSLGPENAVQVDIEGPHQMMPGDTYVICSDGLSNQLTDQEFGAVFNHLPLQEACQFLVDIANLRGGPDNITVVAVRIPGTSEAEAVNGQKKLTGWQALMNKFPWPSFLLALGTALSIFALILAVDQESRTKGIVLFVISAILVLVGLVGMILRRQSEKAQEAIEAAKDTLKVYRRGNAAVDPAIIQKYMQTQTNLLELIKEKGWPIDEKTLQDSNTHVATHIKNGDLIAAFRAQCKSLGSLTEKLRQFRNKDEQFKPNW